MKKRTDVAFFMDCSPAYPKPKKNHLFPKIKAPLRVLDIKNTKAATETKIKELFDECESCDYLSLLASGLERRQIGMLLTFTFIFASHLPQYLLFKKRHVIFKKTISMPGYDYTPPLCIVDFLPPGNQSLAEVK